MGDINIEITPDQMRDDMDKKFMSLEKAVWLAADILPVNNIDIASKRLLCEVMLLQKELGRPQTIGDWRK